MERGVQLEHHYSGGLAVTGNTFPLKKLLRNHGFRWVADEKAWVYNEDSMELRREMRQVLGRALAGEDDMPGAERVPSRISYSRHGRPPPSSLSQRASPERVRSRGALPERVVPTEPAARGEFCVPPPVRVHLEEDTPLSPIPFRPDQRRPRPPHGRDFRPISPNAARRYEPM